MTYRQKISGRSELMKTPIACVCISFHACISSSECSQIHVQYIDSEVYFALTGKDRKRNIHDRFSSELPKYSDEAVNKDTVLFLEEVLSCDKDLSIADIFGSFPLYETLHVAFEIW